VVLGYIHNNKNEDGDGDSCTLNICCKLCGACLARWSKWVHYIVDNKIIVHI